MKLGGKIKLIGIGLLIGIAFAGGVMVGVKIDNDITIQGKIKQKTARDGTSTIKDVTSNLNVKKQTRQEKKVERKQKRLERKNK